MTTKYTKHIISLLTAPADQLNITCSDDVHRNVLSIREAENALQTAGITDYTITKLGDGLYYITLTVSGDVLEQLKQAHNIWVWGHMNKNFF
tara:strand:- start:58 stop:333 length:276 start_codon:yes stop_codon:yes gene_type:complete